MNISLIIPTINRSVDLTRCLDCLVIQQKSPHQLIIIDHSLDTLTQDLVRQEKYNHFDILYHRSAINSGAQARNWGIAHLSKETDIIVFIDDDTSFWPEFLWEIEKLFVENTQANGWVAHITAPLRTIGLMKKIGFFLLTGSLDWNRQFVTTGGFNALPFSQGKQIQTVQRTSGCGMFFRKSIIDEWFRFPERFLKYSLMEDCFLSYAIHTKYPNSLYYVPTIQLVHHESTTSRMANRAKIMQNIIHRYLFVKKFQLSIWWYIWTICLLWLLDLITYQSLSVMKRYIQGLYYIFRNKNGIEQEHFDFNTFIFA